MSNSREIEEIEKEAQNLAHSYTIVSLFKYKRRNSNIATATCSLLLQTATSDKS